MKLWRVIRARGIGYPFSAFRRTIVPHFVYRLFFASGVLDRRGGRCLLAAAGLLALFTAVFLLTRNPLIGAIFPGGIVLGGLALFAARRRRRLRRLRAKFDASHVAAGDTEVLGRFDNDGRFLKAGDDAHGLKTVDEGEFIPRYRFGLELVNGGADLSIRKSYRGDRGSLIREALALDALHGVHAVPALHRIHFKDSWIEKTFVPGSTVRDLLVEGGANILTADTDNDPQLRGMPPHERIEAVLSRGREVFNGALPDGFTESLAKQLDSLHERGVTGFSLTFGNVVVHAETGEPWFIDFDRAVVHRSTSTLGFRRARDLDRKSLNQIWGLNLFTEEDAKACLNELRHGYAPLDIGGGLATWGFWSIDSGTGRWEYINGKAMDGLLQGKRILDLGSNNGVMPMMMLRDGAVKVVGLELSEQEAIKAKRLHRLFEWYDMKPYDLEILPMDMREVLTRDLGPFDVVTSFCSLYYLTPSDMKHLVRRAAEIAPVFIVQAKTDTRSWAKDDKAIKSSIPFLQELLLGNGFGSVDIVAPKRYSRPLLIARSEVP